MWNLKNVVTSIICHAVEKLPFVFPQRLKDAKDGYFSNKSYCLDLGDLSPQETLTHYSLLDPDYNHKILGVRNLRSLPQEDAAAALRWKERHEIWRKDAPESYRDHSNEIQLGNFFVGEYTGKSKLPRGRKVRASAKYTSHCFLSLMELKNGDFFLDSHWFFTEEATRLLQLFSVEHLPYRATEYETCNPFKHNFSAAKLPNRANLCDRELIRRINELHSEVERIQRVVQKKLSVKSIDNGISTLEVLSGKGEPYFYEALLPTQQHRSATKYHAIGRDKKIHSLTWEAEKGETVLFSPGILKKTNIKHLAMSYVASDKFECTIFEYRESFFPAKINYSLFQYYLLLSKQFDLATAKYKSCIAKSLTKPSSNYSKLYDVNINVMEIIFRVKSILNDNSFFTLKMKEKAVERVKKLIEFRLSRLNVLNEEVEERKAICHEKVLAENLGYQKTINRLVVLLAVLQVIVAVIALNAPIALSWFKEQVISMLP